MEFIVFLLIGALAGYLAGQLMGRSDSLLINILIGIVGGMIGGWLFGGLFSGLPTLGPISLGGIITELLAHVSFFGLSDCLRNSEYIKIRHAKFDMPYFILL